MDWMTLRISRVSIRAMCSLPMTGKCTSPCGTNRAPSFPVKSVARASNHSRAIFRNISFTSEICSSFAAFQCGGVNAVRPPDVFRGLLQGDYRILAEAENPFPAFKIVAHPLELFAGNGQIEEKAVAIRHFHGFAGVLQIFDLNIRECHAVSPWFRVDLRIPGWTIIPFYFSVLK